MATVKRGAKKKAAKKTKAAPKKRKASSRDAAKKKGALPSTHQALIDYALAMPGAWADNPWGEVVAKVGKKVFVFFGTPGSERFGMSVKLPHSAPFALELSFTEPTGYGLAKAGWVSAVLSSASERDVDDRMLRAWIDESYRAVAPKKLVRELDGRVSS